MKMLNAERLSDLHDAELRGVHHDPSKQTIECSFANEDGSFAKMILSGVERFRFTDFGVQNVVLRMLVADSIHHLTEADIRGHISWISSTSDGEQLRAQDDIDSDVRRVLAGNAMLMILVPSWGAQFAAIALDAAWIA
jgi:hypothetical protein